MKVIATGESREGNVTRGLHLDRNTSKTILVSIPGGGNTGSYYII